MTLTEFEEINSWGDLISFAREVGYDVFDNVVDSEYLDEWVDDRVMSWSREGWEYLRDKLYDIPTGYSYYVINDYDDVNSVNDSYDFYDEKSDFEDWCLENEVFEAEDEECLLTTEIPAEESFECDLSLEEFFAA